MKSPIVGDLPSAQLSLEDKKFLIEKEVDEKIAWDKKPPDILLGVKDSVQILKNCKISDMPSGLQLIHSEVGWIVAGEKSLEKLLQPSCANNATEGAMNPHVANEEMNARLGKVKKKSDVANEPSEFSN